MILNRMSRKKTLQTLRYRSGLTQQGVADKLGIPRSTLATYENDDQREIPYDIVKQLAKIYNTSEENILKSDSYPLASKSGKKHFSNETSKGDPAWDNAKNLTKLEDISIRNLPFLPVKARATFAEYYADSHLDSFTDMKVVYGYESKEYDNAVVIEIDGDSMEPQLRHGMEVLALPVNLADLEYKTSGVYAVLYDTTFVVKRIAHNSPIDKRITLKSDNPTGGSFDVPYSRIRAMWHIVDIVRGKVQ
jgi:repressor LexA